MAHDVLLQVFDGRLRQHQRSLQHPVRQRRKTEHLRVRGACIMTSAGTECRRRRKGYCAAWRMEITAVSPRLDGSSCACIPHTPLGRPRVERRATLGRLGRVGCAAPRCARVTGAPESERTWWKPWTGAVKHSAIASTTLPSCTMLPAPKPRGARAAALMLDDMGARGAIEWFLPPCTPKSAQTRQRTAKNKKKTISTHSFVHIIIFLIQTNVSLSFSLFCFVLEGNTARRPSHCLSAKAKPQQKQNPCHT